MWDSTLVNRETYGPPRNVCLFYTLCLFLLMGWFATECEGARMGINTSSPLYSTGKWWIVPFELRASYCFNQRR